MMTYSKHQMDLEYYSMTEEEKVMLIMDRFPSARIKNNLLIDYYRHTFGSVNEDRVLSIAQRLRE